MKTIDLYCERLSAEFWAEPINALTNIAFIIAAWGIWRMSRRSAALTPSIWMLIVTSIAIGCGSFTFHTVATIWARVPDILPILVFQLVFIWLYCRGVIALSRRICGLLLAGYLAAAILGRQFPAILNGSLIYAPAFITILALGIFHFMTVTIGRFDLLATAAVLVAAIFFRSIDNTVCSSFPTGTHFIWHILNGAVVLLAALALIRQRQIQVQSRSF